MALACDIRIASSRARFAFKQVTIRITLAWGGCPRLIALVGSAYLGDDQSRQVRVDAHDQNRGDHASRHHRVGRGQRRGKKTASG